MTSWRRFLLMYTNREWLIFFAVVVLVGLLVHPYRAQQASRYALTAAIVENGSVILDDYEDVLVVDRAVRDGHLYSDKAPGQPMYAVPFFLIGKWIGIEDARVLRVDKNLGLWWVTFVSSVLPGAALVVLMYRRARQFDRFWSLPAVAAIFLGTLLFPLSSLLFGHVMAATLLYAAYILLVQESSLALRFPLAGFLSGMAVAVEYTAFFGVVVLAAFVLYQHRIRFLVFSAGGLPAAAALGFYNWIAFGNPLTLSYQFSAFSNVPDSARSLTTTFAPASLDNTVSLFFDGRGLLVATPVVLVALAAAIWRLGRGFQADAAMATAMFAIFILLPIFWSNPWGGASPGPRYMTPALPFLAIPLIWAMSRWRILAKLTIGISVLTMFAATLTDPLALPRDSHEGLGYWLRVLLRGETVDTLPTMAMGSWGWLPHGVVLGGLLYLIATTPHPQQGQHNSH